MCIEFARRRCIIAFLWSSFLQSLCKGNSQNTLYSRSISSFGPDGMCPPLSLSYRGFVKIILEVENRSCSRSSPQNPGSCRQRNPLSQSAAKSKSSARNECFREKTVFCLTEYILRFIDVTFSNVYKLYLFKYFILFTIIIVAYKNLIFFYKSK